MSLYLSDEWHAAAKALSQGAPERPGASVRMAFVVAASPDGDRKYFQVIEDGRVVEQANGACESPDFTMSLTWDDSVRIQRGELDATAAVMQGRLKVAGNMAKLLAVMPMTASAEYKAIQEQIRDITEF